jgi:hypothetical protein
MALYALWFAVALHSGATKAHVTVHQRTHTGEKPYACGHCPYRSTHLSAVNRHVLRKHPEALAAQAAALDNN